MPELIIREPIPQDKQNFITTMKNSKDLHHPWVEAPISDEEFDSYILRSNQVNQKCFLLCDDQGNILGVFNVSEIVHGKFQSAYLGFYACMGYQGEGYMSKGLKLVLAHIFKEIKLHRIEANIQPENQASINLVKANCFLKEGYSPRYLNIDGKWCDHERWALTYETWKENLDKDPLMNQEQAIIRASNIEDITIIVELSYQKRKIYEQAQPQFWRHARSAEEIQEKWFIELLSRDDHIILVSESKSKINGFIIGRLMKAPEVYDPGGLTLMVDDFCVEEPKLWINIGRSLLDKAREIARTRGASQLLVVSGDLDLPKQDFLKKQGLSIASNWYVGNING